MNRKLDLVSFDIDGTLLNDKKKVSKEDYNTLIKLGELNICRIAATGRNLFSLKRVLPPDFPIDYAVFSSGCGIYDWKGDKLLESWNIPEEKITKIIAQADALKLNFILNKPIPLNHHMLSSFNWKRDCDLSNYVNFYRETAASLDRKNIPKQISQAIVLIDKDIEIYSKIKTSLPDLKTILTTSPVNHHSLWIEVFNAEVSKGKGLEWLAKYKGISLKNSFSIGNDYNDIDLLNSTTHSFVVSNAPKALLSSYNTTESNNNSGFSHAIHSFL